MLRFKVHQFRLKGTHYLLLPKLTPEQMQMIAKRLAGLGKVVRSTELVSAKLTDGSIHVDARGLCWARFDPSDAVLPVVPDLLSCRRTKVSTKDLRAKYYRIVKGMGPEAVRFSLRLESGSHWRALRASGDCALAPDEHETAASLLSASTGSYRMVTDYPEDESTVIRIGGRRFFESNVESEEAASTLRVAGERAPRNSYIPADGILRLAEGSTFQAERNAKLFDSLGEWCYYSL